MTNSASPPLPSEHPDRFYATVHGTVFCDRSSHVDDVAVGDPLMVLPGPPVDDAPGVWIHCSDGAVLGHLPPEIETWLAPWMLRGGCAEARVVRVSGADTPSWRRLLIEVRCGSVAESGRRAS